ncbi:MAG: NAD(P)-dependent oxidoreductase [Actinomycetota bacterium]
MSEVDSLLITGSAGFVGQSVLDYLASISLSDRPRRIGLVSHKQQTYVPAELAESTEIDHLRADLLEPWEMKFEATHILHLAADGSSSAYSDKASRDFVTMTKNMCEWAATLQHPIVFHASSGACFGHVPLSENSSVSSGEGLSAKKKVFIENRLAAESVVNSYHQQGVIDLRVGRLYSFIGSHLREKPHYAVPHFVQMALHNRKIEISGNPRTTRSYLSAEDMSDWIYRALNPKVSSEILSIGSEVPVTLGEVATFVADKTNSEIIYLDPLREGDYYVASNGLTRDRLGVEERTSWQTSLESYIETCRGMDTNE